MSENMNAEEEQELARRMLQDDLDNGVLPIQAWTQVPVTEPDNRAKARRAVGFAAAQLERDIAQDEALRGLLSYCEAEAGLAHVQEQSALAYADVADKLKGILDGER